MTNHFGEVGAVHIGADLEVCGLAVVAVHGRGQSAAFMIDHVVARMEQPMVAWVLPQAPGNTWYPLGFLAPLADNQPDLDRSLQTLTDVYRQLEQNGVPPERTVWLGFSQGACLVLEWVARHPARWGGVVAYTGGLIGPPDLERTIDGSLADVPAYFGVGSHDEWVPADRVEFSAARYRAAGAEVSMEVFPGRPHEVCDAEIAAGRRIIERAIG